MEKLFIAGGESEELWLEQHRLRCIKCQSENITDKEINKVKKDVDGFEFYYECPVCETTVAKDEAERIFVFGNIPYDIQRKYNLKYEGGETQIEQFSRD